MYMSASWLPFSVMNTIVDGGLELRRFPQLVNLVSQG